MENGRPSRDMPQRGWRNRKRWWDRYVPAVEKCLIRGVEVGPIMNRLKAYLTVNDVETGKSEAYPYLKLLELDARMEDVFYQSVAIINSLPHWKLVSAEREQGLIQAEVRTRFFKFVDDFSLQMTEGPLIVASARSKSRIGKGDFGKNAKNIELFFKELRKRVRIP
jgi:uncharacterized protein (DUF1499 family)